jgi:hypothetical protein
MSIKKLIKNHYESEINKVGVPDSPFKIEQKENRALGFVLSFALTAVSILFLAFGFPDKPSPLAEQITDFSRKYELEKVFLNSLENIKTSYNQIFKEE